MNYRKQMNYKKKKINIIKTIFYEFEYKKIDNVTMRKDEIILQSKQISVKNLEKGITEKNINKIAISSDTISLLTNQTYKNDYKGINKNKLVLYIWEVKVILH